MWHQSNNPPNGKRLLTSKRMRSKLKDVPFELVRWSLAAATAAAAIAALSINNRATGNVKSDAFDVCIPFLEIVYFYLNRSGRMLLCVGFDGLTSPSTHYH